jgi:hypothetical protein
MRASAQSLAFALFMLVTAVACQGPDVGQRCVLSWNQGGPVPPPTPVTAEADYFETGNPSCDDLICIVSHEQAGTKYGDCAGDACGYCSKPCVSDRDCYSSQTGLKCRMVVLDPTYIAELGQKDPLTLQRYLGDTRNTTYCVAH